MQGVPLAERLAKLTSGQRDCLRLVAEHRSSKEIARTLSISSHTVDQRLKRATAILGVDTRFEAARVFTDCESHATTPSEPYDGLVYQSPELQSGGNSSDSRVSVVEQDPGADGMAGLTLHEAQARYMSGVVHGANRPSPFSVLLDERFENGLSAKARLLTILAIVFAGIAGFALLVNIVEGLSRIY